MLIPDTYIFNSGAEMFYDSCKDEEADTIADGKAFWIHFSTKTIQTVKILTPVLIALKYGFYK